MPLNYEPGVIADWKAQIEFGKEVVANLQIFVDTFGGPDGLSQDQRLWMHSRWRAMPYTFPDGNTVEIDMLNFLICGEIKAAAAIIQQIQPDDFTKEYHCIDQGLIDALNYLVLEFLGWLPPPEAPE